NLDRQKFRGNVHNDVETVGEAHLLNIQILLEKLYFISQRDQLPAGIFDDAAQKITQPCDHTHSSIVSFFAYQSGDSIERVEQEVRLDRPPQRLKSCLGKLLVEAGGLSLLTRQSLSRLQGIADSQDHGVQEQGRNQPVQEPVIPELHERWGKVPIG